MAATATKTLGRLPYPWEDMIGLEEGGEPDWVEEDKAEWERLEDLRGWSHQGRSLHTNRDGQDCKMHQLHLETHPCWLCGHPNMYYFAQGRVKVEYSERKFHCVRCHVRLAHVVPFLDLRSWYWGRPEDMSISETREALNTWEKNDAAEERGTEEA